MSDRPVPLTEDQRKQALRDFFQRSTTKGINADKFKAELETLQSIGVSVKDIATEFIRVAANNPLVGMVSVIIIGDVLYRMKIIDDTAWGLIVGITLTAFGVSTAGTIISDIAALVDAITGQGKGNAVDPADLIKPIATTIVYPAQPNTASGGGGGGQAAQGAQMLPALLKMLPEG